MLWEPCICNCSVPTVNFNLKKVVDLNSSALPRDDISAGIFQTDGLLFMEKCAPLTFSKNTYFKDQFCLASCDVFKHKYHKDFYLNILLKNYLFSVDYFLNSVSSTWKAWTERCSKTNFLVKRCSYKKQPSMFFLLYIWYITNFFLFLFLIFGTKYI